MDLRRCEHVGIGAGNDGGDSRLTFAAAVWKRGTKFMDYDIPHNSKSCSVSGRSLQPGEVYYSAVFDTVTGLERRDYAPEHWPGKPEGAIGFWRGRLPEAVNETRPQPVSVEQMMQLFEQITEDRDPQPRRLRYVLALLLMRRKAFKLQSIDRSEEGETLVLTSTATKETVRVADPQLHEDEIEKAEAELYVLLDPSAEVGGGGPPERPQDGDAAAKLDMIEESHTSEIE